MKLIDETNGYELDTCNQFKTVFATFLRQMDSSVPMAIKFDREEGLAYNNKEEGYNPCKNSTGLLCSMLAKEGFFLTCMTSVKVKAFNKELTHEAFIFSNGFREIMLSMGMIIEKHSSKRGYYNEYIYLHNNGKTW